MLVLKACDGSTRPRDTHSFLSILLPLNLVWVVLQLRHSYLRLTNVSHGFVDLCMLHKMDCRSNKRHWGQEGLMTMHLPKWVSLLRLLGAYQSLKNILAHIKISLHDITGTDPSLLSCMQVSDHRDHCQHPSN